MNSVRRYSAIALAIAAIFPVGAARADDAASLQVESRRLARNTALTGESHVSSRISQGMGWGNIAKSQGVTLGSVVSGMKNANHDLSAIHSHRIGATNAVATSAGATTAT